MQSEDSVADRELTEHRETIRLVSEDVRDLDRLLTREVSLLTAASLFTSADSMIGGAATEGGPIPNPTKAFIEKRISNATMQDIAVHQDDSQELMLSAVVGVVLLLACCFPLWGCLRLNGQSEAS